MKSQIKKIQAKMQTRKFRSLLIGATVLLLTVSIAVGAVSGAGTSEQPVVALENVRAYAPAASPDGVNYAVDSGHLFASTNAGWRPVAVPSGVIVNAVVTDRQNPDTVYIGAANSLTVYVSRNAGQSWLAVPLDTDAIGGVTALAFDGANRLLYVGTDTDGVHRLRDVGASLIASGHLLLDEPVVEMAADSSGAGLAFARTDWNLYRAEEFGLRWVTVEDLPSPATAVAIAPTSPPTVYVGTASSGVRMSQDGVTWQPMNQGLGYTPGSQLFVSDLAVDPAQPQVVYAGTSLMFGSGNARLSPIGVTMSTDGGANWATLAEVRDAQVAEILPVTGATGAVYALTTASRTPLALGEAPALVAAQAAPGPNAGLTSLLAWTLAGIAAAALIAIAVTDYSQRRRRRETEQALDAVKIG